MSAETAVVKFVAEYCDYGQSLASDDDIFHNARITGDDADDFMVHFADKFGVDMTNYRWYFHHEEEGHNFGGVFFKSPDRQVDYIPITTALLAEAIRTRKWPIKYPAHELPSVRKDILINQLLAGISLLGLIFFLWMRFVP